MRNFGNLTPPQAKEAVDKLATVYVMFDNAGAEDATTELENMLADLDAAFPGIAPGDDCVWIPNRKPER